MVTFTKAAIALHNYLRTEESSVYCPPGFVDGEDGAGNVIDGNWRRDDEPVTDFEYLGPVGGNRYTKSNFLYHCALMNFVHTAGTLNLLLMLEIRSENISVAQLAN